MKNFILLASFLFVSLLTQANPTLVKHPAEISKAKMLPLCTNTLASQNVFIDKSVGLNHFKINSSFLGSSFQLYSHGRSGELLLNGKWCNATQIATFLQPKIQNSKFKIQNLNIYGCEFAKGEKGLQAIKYLENTLNISVSASTNITGKDGDWILEVGKSKDIIALNNYNGNLQWKITDTCATCDFDGDGILNNIDIDDDNDGILDAVEAPTCYYTAAEMAIPTAVTTTITGAGATTNLFDNISTTIFAFPSTLAPNALSKAILELTPTTSQIATSIILNLNTATSPIGTISATATVKAQGWNGSAWVDLATYTASPAINSNVQTFTFSNTTAYSKYRLFESGTNGVAIGTYAIQDVSLGFPATYTQSLNRKPTCAADPDGDGFTNNFDLDSDGDGCPDAKEAGVTGTLNASTTGGGIAASTANAIAAGPYGANGLANAIESSDLSNATTSYYSTYNNFAIVASINACTDTDGDGIPDVIDIDDDNDGVLDKEEQACSVADCSTMYDRRVILNTSCSYCNSISGTYIGATSGLVNVTATTNKNFYLIRDNSFNSNATCPDGVAQVSNSAINYYTGATTGITAPYTVTYTFDKPVLNPSLVFSSNQGSVINFPTPVYLNSPGSGGGTAGTMISTLPACECVQSVILPGIYTSISFSVPNVEQQMSIILYLDDVLPVGTPTQVFSILQDFCMDLDTDGDGIPNRLDLDSDGDGCPDAKESGVSALVGISMNNAPGGMGVATGTANAVAPSPYGVNGFSDFVETSAESGIYKGAYTYKPLALSKTLNACTDTDGDGIPDLTDLDDDNDGILDAVESPSCYYNSTEVSSIYATGTDLNWLINYPINYATDGDINSHTQANGAGQAITNQTVIEFSDSVGAFLPISSLNLNMTGYGLSNSASDGAMFLQGWDGLNWVNLSTNVTNAIATTTVVFNNTLQPTGLFSKYRVRGFSGNAGWAYIGEASITLGNTFISSAYPKPTCISDLDGDGIPNQLDLDSDGDGCPDAKEGGGIFTALVSSSIAGGNSGAGFTGIIPNPGAVVLNLGNTVGNTATTMGVPTIAGTGQTVNYSQNKFFNYCTDTDGDGIPDYLDLDDDNDGILDVVECPLIDFAKITPAMFGYNTTTTVGAINVSNVDISSNFRLPAGSIIVSITNGSALYPSTNFMTDNAKQPKFTFTGTAPLLVRAIQYKSLGIGKDDGIISNDGSQYTYTSTLTNGLSLHNSPANTYYVQNDTVSNTITPQANDYIWESNDTISSISYYSTNASNNAFALYIKAIDPSYCPDTDGDGIPDYLDLDSDGDGCPDAKEAGVSALAGITMGNAPAGMGAVTGTGNAVAPAPYGANGFSDFVETSSESGSYKGIYTYNQYAINNKVNLCDDCDGDGIPNFFDLDDDNDGVLDAVECSSCYYTAAEIAKPSAVTSMLTYSAGSNATLIDSSSATTTTFTAGQSTTGLTIFEITPVTAMKMDTLSFEMNSTTSFLSATTNSVQVQGWTGAAWVNVTDTITPALQSPASAGGFVKIPITKNQANYLKYKLVGTAAGTVAAYPIREIKLVTKSTYVPSAYPKLTGCPLNATNDKDGDGLLNSCDLDSDGDGCGDAYESGATNITSLFIIAGPYGGNGFADALQASADTNSYINVNYTTYSNAINSAVHNCCPSTGPSVTPNTASYCSGGGTVNLNSLSVTSTPPANSRIVWSTHLPATSSSDTLTTAQVTALSTIGKYYVYYVVGNCFSSAADSVVVSTKAPSTSTVNQTVCASSLPYVWHGTSYNAAGAYVYHTTNAVGCDSAVTLNLTVTPTGTWVGGATGNWSVPANWCPGVPTSATNVVIPAGSVVTIDTANAFANTIDIKAGGGITMSGTKDLTITPGGTFNNSGTFNGTASTGAVVFGGSGTISGTTTFNNIKTSGALDFGTSSSIAGTFSLLPGGSVTGHSPTYICPTAVLAYKTRGTFTRGLEWTTASSGVGYPSSVYVQDTTTLNVGAAGVGYICYDLQIDTLCKFDQSAGGSVAIHVGRNVTIKGTLTLGTSSGGDISLGGSWTRNIGGIFNHYDRKVTFDGPANFSGNGTSVSTISAPASTVRNNEGAFGGENFAHLWMNKTSVGNQISLLSNITIDKEIKFIKGTFNTNVGDVTIVSDLLHTADVAKVVTPADVVVTYGSGRFVIQRFIHNQSTQRSWRFLTSPLQYSDPLTINNAWQEGQVNPVKTNPQPTNPWPAADSTWCKCGLPVQPGFGTHITGPGGIFNGGAGFDQGTNTYSIEWFNNTGATNVWTVPANTTGTTLMSKLAWGLFVRGDRGFVIGDQYVPGANAILEPKGKINIGNDTVPTSMLVAGKYNLIGNPYASQINMTNVVLGGGIQKQYKLWDPKAFVNYTQTGAYVNFTYSNGTTYSYSNVGTTWVYPGTVESSEAFLANIATTEVVFHESDKVDLVSTLNGIQSRSAITRNRNAAPAEFHAYISYLDANTQSFAKTYGAFNMLSSAYNTAVDADDYVITPKASDSASIRIIRGNTQLGTDLSQPLTAGDTVFYYLTKLRQQKHALSFSSLRMETNLSAVLVDKYLNTTTPIVLNDVDTTNYVFDVSSDVQSNRSDRFMVVFKPLNTTPVRFTNVVASAHNSTTIGVKWNVASEINTKQFIVEKSTDGIHFETASVQAATNNSNYNWLDASASMGENYYRIVSIDNDGNKQYSIIVKATIIKALPIVRLLINPIVNNTIALEFKNAEIGNYTVKMMNQMGQTIMQQSLKISTTNSVQKIAMQKLPSAVYDLETMSSTGAKEVLKVIVP